MRCRISFVTSDTDSLVFLKKLSLSGLGKGDSRNSFGKLNDPGKSALRRLGILPQQLTTSPLFARTISRRPLPLHSALGTAVSRRHLLHGQALDQRGSRLFVL